MKILYVITALGVGGAENLLVDACTALKHRHDITIVYLSDLRSYEKQITDMGIKTIFLNLSKYGFINCVFRLKKIIKELHIDIVHTHLPTADTIGRISALMVKNVKVITTIHNTDTWKQSKHPKYLLLKMFNFLSANCFKRVKLVAVSNSVKDYCVKYEHIPDKKITVIYNFINHSNDQKSDANFTDRFKTTHNFVMIIVARMEKDKGHITLLRAMEKLRESGQDISLIVLGEGSLRGELEAFVTEHGLAQNVTFLGNVKNVYDYLRHADLFVLPSYNEGQSIAVLESFYCKTPVLTSDIPANSELLGTNMRGVTFHLGDESDLANKITAIMEGDYDLDKITKNAYEYFDSLTIEKHIGQLEELYTSF